MKSLIAQVYLCLIMNGVLFAPRQYLVPCHPENMEQQHPDIHDGTGWTAKVFYLFSIWKLFRFDLYSVQYGNTIHIDLANGSSAVLILNYHIICWELLWNAITNLIPSRVLGLCILVLMSGSNVYEKQSNLFMQWRKLQTALIMSATDSGYEVN